nr:hypothetical protein [Tanacetum cinerariifolium]
MDGLFELGRNFVIAGNDKDMSFIIETPSQWRPLASVPSFQLVDNTADSNDPNTGEKQTLVVGSSCIGDRAGRGLKCGAQNNMRDVLQPKPVKSSSMRRASAVHILGKPAHIVF